MICFNSPYHFKLYTGCIPQILLGPFLYICLICKQFHTNAFCSKCYKTLEGIVIQGKKDTKWVSSFTTKVLIIQKENKIIKQYKIDQFSSFVLQLPKKLSTYFFSLLQQRSTTFYINLNILEEKPIHQQHHFHEIVTYLTTKTSLQKTNSRS